MENAVYIKKYRLTEPDIKEIMRYAGAKEHTPEIDSLLKECLKETEDKLLGKVCYREIPINFLGGYVDLGFIKLWSKGIKNSLKNCQSIVLFGATVGLEIDRLIARYGVLSPAKALMLQAIGAERIECLCDMFCREISEEKQKEGKGVLPRFSPGYRDLPLEVQRDIFRVLEPSKKIGLTINESLIMSPLKSVTAIIGITDKVESCKRKDGCRACDKTDCEYRRTV